MEAEDAVDAAIREFARALPRVDPRAIAVTGRIRRGNFYLDRNAEEVFKRFHTSGASYDVLAALYAVGRPYALTPTELYRGHMMSSAGVTARLDGVERNGLAVRSRDPRDRRGVIVTLTGKGQKLVRDAAQALFARQSFIPSLYSERERKQLLALLRRLLGSIERTGPGVSLPAYETAAAAWLEAFPQANPWLIEFLLILAMLSVRINRRGDELLGPFDLSQTALCILAALRRSGDRHRLSPRALSEAALLSSGGMTAQLDQLEGRGLVERSRDLTDRRGIQVMLTRSGQKLADPALAAYLAGHQRMLTGLSPPDRQALATLLRTLLLATEPDPRPDPSLSSAHLIGPRRRRRTAIIPGPGSALP